MKRDSNAKELKDAPKSRERGRSSEKDGDRDKKSRSSVDRRDRSRSRHRSRSSSQKRKRRERSPTPRPTRIHIGRLTRNVTKEHVTEIFACYGEIKNVEFPVDRMHYPIGRGYAYVEYISPDDAENAMKHMDGGQIDGQEITASPVLPPKQRGPPRRSPIRNRQPMRGWRSPPRYRRRSPIRRSPRRRRTRSPRRRHRSNSSSSSH